MNRAQREMFLEVQLVAQPVEPDSVQPRIIEQYLYHTLRRWIAVKDHLDIFL